MVAAVIAVGTVGCGARDVSPSSYTGQPDSAFLTLSVQSEGAERIAVARVTEEDDQSVVVEVRLEPADGVPAGASMKSGDGLLEAEVQLDSPLGGRQVVDTLGRAVPQT